MTFGFIVTDCTDYVALVDELDGCALVANNVGALQLLCCFVFGVVLLITAAAYEEFLHRVFDFLREGDHALFEFCEVEGFKLFGVHSCRFVTLQTVDLLVVHQLQEAALLAQEMTA